MQRALYFRRLNFFGWMKFHSAVRAIALLLLFSGSMSMAFAQDVLWAGQFTSLNRISGETIAVDNSGNMYITGYFQAPADLDPGPATAQLVPTGNWDIFIAKLNAAGELIWAKQIGGDIQAYCRDSAVDEDGNLYMVGQFQGTVDFDPGPGVFNLTSAGGNDIFLCKLDALGNLVWAKSFGGTLNDNGNAISVADTGEVCIGGTFQSTVVFDQGTGNYAFTSAAGSDAYICKFDAEGDVVWAGQLSGLSSVTCWSIARDENDAMYVAGNFNGTADFDPGQGIVNLTSAGGQDAFVCKFDAANNLVWAKRLGGVSGVFGRSVRVDGSGNVITVGYFSETLDLDPGAGTHAVTSAGDSDVFVSKLNSEGDFVWGKHFGGIDEEISTRLALDINDDIYITGYFNATADMNPSDTESFTLNSSGQEDVFISKIDASGNFVWAKGIGSPGWDYGRDLALDQSGTVYATGHFYMNATFNPSGPETFAFTSGGFEDAFVLKLGQCLSTSSLETTTACTSYTWNNTSYTSSGTYALQFTNAAGCDSTATLVLTITSPVEPLFSALAPVCALDEASPLPMTSNNGIEGTWSPQWNGTETTTYTFTPSENQCASTTSLTVEVNTPVEPTFDAVTPICAGETLSELSMTSNNGIEGVWSPSVDNTATTTYTFTPSENQCASTTTLVIEVNPLIEPTFDLVAPICAGETLSDLPMTSNNGIEGVWSPSVDNTATTTYTFTPSENQCANTTTLVIEVNPTPTVSIALNGEVLEATAGFVSYSWTFNGAALQGANSAELTPTANGLYTVTVTDANGCGAEASFNYTGVGVGEEARIFVNLYPNPTNGLLNLTFVDARAREVVVYDNTGKRVHQSVVYGAHERIDLSFLAVGSYHLHVSQGEERLHRVIVVTR